ncbi:Peptidoglycan-binding (PGRP) domain of peptidoglycan hydrolases [Streptomyces sp. cf386]|uniref:peptidoglycan-binding protein n=1 Tax=Streptomyces sp. cf386 TaxID=1761904 RepID=UPI000881AC33|nr:peptidoglycan-binding protein [Streptomyces sp. cf386]SDN11785.1 Peptidoglycan-binding (PGRP) domain of peptidoglycan hydrolases [Streptomyces sp. cf386]
MSRWAVLPAELDPRVRQLVVRLRRLKDHSGLSLRQLAARTGYSPKSWERYLGGRSLPPREAVEALARIGGEDPTRLLALHEVAAEAWARGPGDVTASDENTSVPEPPTTAPEILSAEVNGARPPGGPLLVALVAGAVALVLAVSTAVLLVVRLGGGEGAGEGERTTAPVAAPAAPVASTPPYACRVERIDGRWYAGNSRTHGAVLAYGHAGPEVAEAQCLLRRAGVSPGEVDGIFGPVTERAVRQMQKRSGLVVDGIVGPHTWKALRR